MRQHFRPPAFTLIELLLVVAIIALLISILLPAIGKARNAARVAICTSNMRQLVVAQQSYSSDYKELIGALNWRPSFRNGDTPLSQTGNDGILLLQGKHAKDIIDRRTPYNRPLVQNRFFNRNFWHLVLIDGGYFGSTKPIAPAASCPSDDWVLRWQKNENNYSSLVGTSPEPSAVPSGAYEWYRPYWSTYQIAPVAFSPDRRQGTAVYPASQITSRHHLFNNASPIGRRKQNEVLFPSQKVFMFDVFDRHSSRRPIWHAYDAASQPLVFFDGSVRYKRTRDSELGWNPDQPNTFVTDPRYPGSGRRINSWTTYTYNPSTGFPGYDHPTLSGNAQDTVKGYFRWTAKGLQGWDYAK